MSDSFSRRAFLKTGALSTVASTSSLGSEASSPEAVSRASLRYPRRALGRLATLTENVPRAFTFPDAESHCLLVKLGREVPGGVGPQRDVVAYSTMCPHMGCPLAWHAASRTLRCGCHFSMFDASQGALISGQATEDVPRVVLEVDERGELFAVAVEGLLYGRQSNAL